MSRKYVGLPWKVNIDVKRSDVWRMVKINSFEEGMYLDYFWSDKHIFGLGQAIFFAFLFYRRIVLFFLSCYTLS